MTNNGLSIIVPAFNEEGNIKELAKRIYKSINAQYVNKINYEVIVIDDNSTDNTYEEALNLDKAYNVKVIRKTGPQGKAYSLLQGFKNAKYDIIAMIDADLQYPPETIGSMAKMIGKNVDIVVADRIYEKEKIERKIMHHGFRFVFGKLLHNLNCDVQSGLKVFKKEILEKFDLKPSPWTFDLGFLLKARHLGYKIAKFPILFSERFYGESKVKSIQAAWEIGMSSLLLKFKPWRVFPNVDSPTNGRSSKKALMNGFYFNGKKFIHHTTLHFRESAFISLTSSQKIQLLIIGLLLLTLFLLNWHMTIVFILAVITAIYLADLFNNFYLLANSILKKPGVKIHASNHGLNGRREWPKYTIFCPLYKEEEVLEQFVNGINKLDYPKDKLQVMLLLEDDDHATIHKALTMSIPYYFEVRIVPNSQPKTKPKACNYGLQFAKGEYSVIYDAEDIPEPLQLKKAVLAFESLGQETQCVQAKLNFYNPKQNVLTRMFTGEYSLWFDFILTGLQAMSAPIPLGGTSNHFRTSYLKSLKGWDAFNVTEDADLGMRLAKRGYQTAIINSTTYEEANSDIKNWFNQRTRWVKGYIQTYLVHMRDPLGFIRTNGIRAFLYFQLVIGAKVSAMLVNPIMWFLFLTYFIFRPQIGEFIETLFPPPVYYAATFSLLIGNFVYFYNYMLALAAKKKYELVKYAYLVPLYWLMMSVAAWTAVFRLIRQPHYWSKTIHGLHLKNKETIKATQKVVPVYAASSVNT